MLLVISSTGNPIETLERFVEPTMVSRQSYDFLVDNTSSTTVPGLSDIHSPGELSCISNSIYHYIFQSNEFYWFLAGVAANSLSVLNAIKLDFETILHKRGSNL